MVEIAKFHSEYCQGDDVVHQRHNRKYLILTSTIGGVH